MPALVLLPGMDGTGDLFAPFVAALGPGWDVTTVRYPTSQPLGYAELERIARTALPVTGDYLLLGESFSGPVAIALAATRPRGLTGLVLSCSFTRNPRPLLTLLLPAFHLASPRLAPDALLRHALMGAHATPALMTSLKAALREVKDDVFHARLREVTAVDVSENLCNIDVPLLYLRALADRLVPRAAAELVTALVPRTNIVDIDGPHLLLQTQPAQAALAIQRFAADL